MFDDDKNNNTKIKVKITNQIDKTLVTFVIGGNTLTINPRKIGSGIFTLDYTSSYNNLGLTINNKIKKIISDSYTKKMNYRVIQNPNMLTIPENFPKIIAVVQYIEKKINLPVVLDRFRKIVLPKILTEALTNEKTHQFTLEDNNLTITTTIIGNKTIKLKYKSLEKIHTDNRLYTSTSQTLDIILITNAGTNSIIFPTNFTTTFTVTQNVVKTLTLPTVTDSFNTIIIPTITDTVATFNGNSLTINSPALGTKNITLTYSSQTKNGKVSTTQTASILLTTIAPVLNSITIPTNFTTTFTVTQNVAKTLTLPTVTDSFNTTIIPTITDPVATLNGNSLIINSPTLGTKNITLTYTSQTLNRKISATRTTNILLTTIAKIILQNKLTVVKSPSGITQPTPSFKGLYQLNVVVGSDQKNSAEILTVQDVANEDIIPIFSFSSTRFNVSVSLKVINGINKYIADFQYLGGTGNEEVLVDFTWTSKAKTINGKKYELTDSYTNSIRVNLTNQIAKKFVYQKEITYLQNGDVKYLSKRDGEIIKINLVNRAGSIITSIPQVYRLLLFPNYPPRFLFNFSFPITPTLTLNNEGDSSIKFNYVSTDIPTIRLNLTNDSTTGQGVIRLLYKSDKVKISFYKDLDNDGAVDHLIFPDETVTIYN